MSPVSSYPSEYLFLEIGSLNEILLVEVIYKAPNASLGSELETLISFFASNNSNIVLTSDFNIKIDVSNS